jgi:hypothetical protein
VTTTRRSGGDRPGDDFNRNGKWPEIFEAPGWTLAYEKDGEQFWRRPGKDHGVSATTNYADSDLFYPFTTSTPFEPNRGYTKFAVYTLLNHDGDFKAAARDLAKQGYGKAAVEAAGPMPHYVVNEHGTFVERHTREGTVLAPLANFVAEIAGETIRDDGLEQQRSIALCLTFSDRQTFHTEVTAAQFNDVRRLALEAAGPAAIVYPGQSAGDHLRVAIQQLSPVWSRRHVYTSTGWREVPDVGWVYVHAGGALCADGPVEDVSVSLRPPIDEFALVDPPFGASLRNAVRSGLRVMKVAPLVVTVPLLGAVYRAPLGPAELTVWVAGATGVGKTQLVALAQQHFGARLDAQHLPGSWSSTANALAELAFLAADSALVVDDFAPTGTAYDIDRMHATAERLGRAQGNHAGRGRLTRDASLRPVRPPRCLLISTGEDIPRGQSLRARLVIVELGAGDLDWSLLTELQNRAAQGQLAAAMSGYIVHLASRLDEIHAAQGERIAELRELLDTGTHRRIPDSLAHLALGWESYLDFAVTCGALDDAGRTRRWETVLSTLRTVAVMQSAYQATADPAETFLTLLRSALVTGRAHIVTVKGDIPRNFDAFGWHASGDSRGDLIGWVDDDDLYLDPASAYGVAVQLDKGRSLTISAQSLWKRLNEKRLLASTDKRRETLKVRRTLAGATGRTVLHLRTSTLISLVEPDEPDNEDPEDFAWP